MTLKILWRENFGGLLLIFGYWCVALSQFFYSRNSAMLGGTSRYRCLQSILYNDIWCKMDKNRQKWIKIDKNGQKSTKMDKNQQKWIKIDKNRQKSIIFE